MKVSDKYNLVRAISFTNNEVTFDTGILYTLYSV